MGIVDSNSRSLPIFKGAGLFEKKEERQMQLDTIHHIAIIGHGVTKPENFMSTN